MKTRKFDREKDIHYIARWVADQEWSYPPVDDLFPDMGIVAVSEFDVPLACCFVYTTGTSVAQVAWIAAEKDLPLHEKQIAMAEAIKTFQKMAMKIEPPVRLIEIVTRDRGLEPLLKELGFWVKYGFIKATYMPPNDDE